MPRAPKRVVGQVCRLF